MPDLQGEEGALREIRLDGSCSACFLNVSEECGKGAAIENTDCTERTHRGACADIRYFGARQVSAGTLSVAEDRCYGCGLCVAVCPVDCVSTVVRT